MRIIAEENPTNLAYKSCELPLHMDLTFHESPPGLLFLHCIRYDYIVVTMFIIIPCDKSMLDDLSLVVHTLVDIMENFLYTI